MTPESGCHAYSRWPAKICGGTMIRISLPFIWDSGVSIEKIESIKEGDRINDQWGTLLFARWAIDEMFNKSLFSSSLRSSRQSAITLMSTLQKFIEEKDDAAVFKSGDIHSINFYFNQFKTIVKAELETLNAHFVTQKRGYDTMALIDYAEVIFPPELPSKVPAAVIDIRAAGKCIAFELPTAAAFHLHRAHEAILHVYYDQVTGGKPRPTNRNIGDYLAKLREYKVGDDKLMAALRDLKDMHRNPLIHPDQSLETVDEAIALMGSIHNTIVHMLKVIPQAKAASAALLPPDVVQEVEVVPSGQEPA